METELAAAAVANTTLLLETILAWESLRVDKPVILTWRMILVSELMRAGIPIALRLPTMPVLEKALVSIPTML